MRRRFQFRLLSLFAATTAIAIACKVWTMDSDDRKLDAVLGAILVVVSLFLWLLSCAIDFVRTASWKQFDQCQNAEDALLAACRLDILGKWEEATSAYRISAERWPEHRTYIERCIDKIEQKRGHQTTAISN